MVTSVMAPLASVTGVSFGITIDQLVEEFGLRVPAIVETLTEILAESFIAGIRAGAPVMISLLLAIMVLGLISRTLPQLNVFAVGFPLTLAIG